MSRMSRRDKVFSMSNVLRSGTIGAAALIAIGFSIAPGAATASPASAVSMHCAVTHAPRLAASSPWLRNGWLSAQNMALSGRIRSDQSYLSRHGVRLTEWEPDSVTGKIKIYLTRYTAKAARTVYARYGCAVSVGHVSEALGTLTLGRGSDTAPYAGGDFIYLPGGGPGGAWCTGGPIVKNSSGDLRMLIAGHCAAVSGKLCLPQ